MSHLDLYIQEPKNMIFSLLPVDIWRRNYNIFQFIAELHSSDPPNTKAISFTRITEANEKIHYQFQRRRTACG